MGRKGRAVRGHRQGTRAGGKPEQTQLGKEAEKPGIRYPGKGGGTASRGGQQGPEFQKNKN